MKIAHQIDPNIVALISGVVGIEVQDIHPESDLREDLGISAADMTQIIQEVNKKYGLNLDVKSIFQSTAITTVAELNEVIKEEEMLG